VPYLAIRYVRSPASFLADSTASPIFLVRFPLTNPRTLWRCQSVALAISAIVAPFGRRSSARTIAFLLPSRASVMGFLAVFLPTAFLVATGLLADLAFLAPCLALGAPFARLAVLLRGGLLGRNVGARCRNGGGRAGVCGFCVRHGGVFPFRG